MHYLRTTAPADVVAAADWLSASGWTVAVARGGENESFGNLVVEFHRNRDRVVIIRDRAQWMADIQLYPWHKPFDLDIILDAVDGRHDWTQTKAPLPEQLPEERTWIEGLPEALAWSRNMPDAVDLLKDMQRRRSRSLFPPTRRPIGLDPPT